MGEDCVTPTITIGARTSDSELEAGPRIAMGENPSSTMIWNPIGKPLCLNRIASGADHLWEK